MVSIGADGKVAKIEQVLTAENFARVRPGMSRDTVRRLLGKPTKVEAFALKKEEVWGYRWWEQPQEGFSMCTSTGERAGDDDFAE